MLPRKKGDDALPNSIKRKHPRKGEKKKQRARTKSTGRQANRPKEMVHTEEREALSIIKTPSPVA